MFKDLLPKDTVKLKKWTINMISRKYEIKDFKGRSTDKMHGVQERKFKFPRDGIHC